MYLSRIAIGFLVAAGLAVGSVTVSTEQAPPVNVPGIDKPVVVSLAGDVEVEEASEYLFDHKIPAYPYSTEIPVDVLGAKYKWARGAGLL